VDGTGDAVEERRSAEAFGDILRNQDRRHTFSLRGSALRSASPALLQELSLVKIPICRRIKYIEWASILVL
jgi:hypothetical protein